MQHVFECKKNGLIGLDVALFLLAPALTMVVNPFLSVETFLPILLILAPLAAIVTFINTDLALMMLIFSMLLSPEMKLGDVPGRSIVLRIDDVLLIVIFISWLAKVAVYKEEKPLKNTPLNLPIAVLIVVYLFVNGTAVLTGRAHAIKSTFYILKYFEYFMLYFMVTNNVRSKEQIRFFIKLMMITCLITCISAMIFSGSARYTAPFEGEGEPNTFGGYLVLIFAVVFSIFLHSPSFLWQATSGALACLVLFVLLRTFSRGSYIAFIFMYIAIVLTARKKKLLAIGVLILVIVIMLTLLPKIIEDVIARITFTFRGSTVTFSAFEREIGLEGSTAARVKVWGRIFELWKYRPLVGYGVTGVGLIDSQFPLVLGEAGMIGLAAFIWLLCRIFINIRRSYVAVDDVLLKGISLGLFAGYIGLLAHSFSAATFIIVRIMEPFWFLTAIAIMSPHIDFSKKLQLED